MATKEEAQLFISAVQNELAMGTKHYDSRNPDAEVTDVKRILELMLEDALIFEVSDERKPIFDALAYGEKAQC